MPLKRSAMRRYMQKYREEHPQKSYHQRWAKKNPSKVMAQARVEVDKRKGNVSRGGTCARCGSTKNVEVHHTDYAKDKTVKLCRMCHAKTKPNTK